MAAGLLCLTACAGKSLEDRYNEKTYDQDIAVFLEKKLLNEEDKELLFEYIINRRIDSVNFKSYAKILTEVQQQEKIIAEKKKLLNESLTITVTRKYTKNFRDNDGYIRPYLLFDTEIENNTDRQLNSFDFRIHFKNMENEILDEGRFSQSFAFKANSKKTITFSLGRSNELALIDLSKIKIEYEIKQLMYDDGTYLR
jgi:hypothetical protein